MTGVAAGPRWYLRLALALALVIDVLLVSYWVATADPDGPRVLAEAPSALRALLGHPERVLPLSAIALAAVAWFASGRGRLVAGLTAIAVTGFLVEARAASEGGPERFLFAGGTVLLGWIAGSVFSRAAGGEREHEELAAEAGALGAIAVMYMSAAIQKLWISGLGWVDGDALRLVVLSQAELDASPPGRWAADAVSESRVLAFLLAAFVEIAQLSAVAYPFDARARAVVGTMLLCFHAGVRMMTPISFPQSMWLLFAFSYPWQRVFERDAEPRRLELATPLRGLGAIGLVGIALAALAWTPPVTALVASLRGTPGGPPIAAREPEPSFDAASVAVLGLGGGEAVGPCTLIGARSIDRVIVARFDCGGDELVIDLVPASTREGAPPRRAAGYDLFYRTSARSREPPAAIRDAAIEAVARAMERSARHRSP